MIKSKIMLTYIQRESRIAIVILFAAILSVASAQAQAQLSVQTAQVGFYSLELNGQFHDFNQMHFTLPHVLPGMHQVRLHKWVDGIGNQGSWNLLYQGAIQVLPMQNTILNYQPMFGVQILHQPIMVLPNQHGGTVFPNGMHPGWLMGMDNASFQQFMIELNRISFDSNKLTYAQFAIRNNGIYVHQLQMILSRFNFDGNRLELAQFAYPFTIDRQNYFKLQSSFAFQSNFRKLMESL
jgi:hypothetical protein